MKYLSNIGHVALRELDILRKNRIYGFCMIVFPLLLVFFFTTMLDEGIPQDLPVGVVDQDNSATSRGLIRNLDAMQNSRVVYRFANVTEARNAMQEGKVYAYLYIPEGTSAKLLAGRQPKISYYYTMTCMTAGSMAMKDMKTIGTLGSAAVGQATLSAKGASKEQIKAALQAVTVDAHMIANPEGSYNYSLTTVFVPGILMLFMALLSAYALGMEMKFDTGKEWLALAGDNMLVAIIGKYIVHALVFLLVIFFYQYYIFEVLDFPREYLVAMVGTQYLDVRIGLPRGRHGYTSAGHVVALPPASLLDDLSSHGAQWVPRHRCLVPSRGTRGVHAAALVRA